MEGKSEQTYHAYYQWVPFVLFLQGILFYLPHHVWKTLEDRKLDKITNGLRGRTLSLDERKDQCEVLVKYIRETFHMHNFYAFKYFICDLLNFVNVIGQMYLINTFLGGVFMAYGTEVLYWSDTDPEERNDPMVRVFPRVTKCTFHKYGPSGTIERHDTMCILALNIINEKIFVFLWFWLALLAVATLVHVAVAAAALAIPAFRTQLLGVAEEDPVVKKANFGDWFLLYLLRKNMDSVLFKDFMFRLAHRMAVKENQIIDDDFAE